MTRRAAAPRAAGEQQDASGLRAAHELFVTTGRTPARAVRSLVVESWRRSRLGGVDPESVAPPRVLSGPDLDALRREHPLAAAVPAIRHLLVQPAAGWITALTDDTGRLLWVDGDHEVRRRVERVGFVEGALWREDSAGTNAPGVALATDSEVQVRGAEHWLRAVQPFSCAAAPVHAPSGRLLGVLDVTGGPVVASDMAMALVRATVAAIEATIASAGPAPGSVSDTPWLRVLGPRRPVLRTPGGEVHLSGRHSEILLLLTEHPAGLSADELACLLSADDLSDVTARAEISRLRRVVGPLLSQSRPYQLTRAVHTDVEAVRGALDVGDVGLALAGYPGPVLPRSVAPGVERVRTDLAGDVRAAVLSSGDLEVLARWTACSDGADDWAAWRAIVQAAAPGSAAQLRAAARLAAIERELAPMRRRPAAVGR
ncbi:MAG: transcriptional regulator [Cellulomonas sp.]|nr:transcriptional regulator [Cellulomonas sp.]